jgi:hypothetical protein
MPATRNTRSAAARSAAAYRKIAQLDNPVLDNGLRVGDLYIDPKVEEACETGRLPPSYARYVASMIPPSQQLKAVHDEIDKRAREDQMAHTAKLLEREERKMRKEFRKNSYNRKFYGKSWNADPVANGWMTPPPHTRPVLPSFTRRTTPLADRLDAPPPTLPLSERLASPGPSNSQPPTMPHAMRNSVIQRKQEYHVLVNATSKRLFNYRRRLTNEVLQDDELATLFDNFKLARETFKESWRLRDVDWNAFKRDCKKVGAIPRTEDKQFLLEELTKLVKEDAFKY